MKFPVIPINIGQYIPVPPLQGSKFEDTKTGVLDFGTRYTQIVKTDLTTTWTIPHSSFDYSRIDQPYAMLVSYRWSPDGEYVYLYPYSLFGPGGFKDSSVMGTLINELYRFNLQNGELEPVLSYKTFKDFEISPDSHWLIYSEAKYPGVLHFRDLNSGDEKELVLDNAVLAAGAFTWTRDSSSVVIFTGFEKVGEKWGKRSFCYRSLHYGYAADDGEKTHN